MLLTRLSYPVLREKYDYKLRLSRNNYGDFYVDNHDEAAMRKMWQDQIVELKKRAEKKMAPGEAKWGLKTHTRDENQVVSIWLTTLASNSY